MASLDFSVDKAEAGADGRPPHDPKSLVDATSLGTRNRDGLYEVKDWDFSSAGEAADSVIARALSTETAPQSTSSLGALGSVFARLTGSKVLTDQDLKPVLEGMKQHLMKKNVAMEIADKICEGVGESLLGKKVGGFQSKSLCRQFCPILIGTISNQQCRSHGAFCFLNEDPYSKDVN